MLHPDQAVAIARKSGLPDADALTRCVLKCGFDTDAYFDRNPELRQAGLDALGHFLEHGYAEARQVPTGPLPQGLDALGKLSIPDQAYRRTLFKTFFRAQVRHPATAGRLWQRIDTTMVAAIRGMGGHPYIVFGDSHAHHYIRKETFGLDWLAGMPLVCHGASAGGLTRGAPLSKDGAAIMRWAEANAASELPIFLKFGGLDAEFRWISYRLRHDMEIFSEPQFDEYAARAVQRYGTFLDRLAAVAGPDLLRVCSTFPATRTDEHWIEGYRAVHDVPPDRLASRDAALSRLEIPDFPTRTRLRGRYNARLRDMCAAKGLRYLDAFTPFLEAGGGTDRRYLAFERDSSDYYMDQVTIGPKLAPLIHACVAAG